MVEIKRLQQSHEVISVLAKRISMGSLLQTQEQPKQSLDCQQFIVWLVVPLFMVKSDVHYKGF